MGVAEAFLSFGAHVHIIGFTTASVEKAIALLKEEYPDPALSIAGSTSDVRDESAITETLRALAPVDHIVYTAVDARIRGPIGGLDIASAKDLFGVKFWGQVAVAKGASECMRIFAPEGLIALGPAIANYDIIKPGGSYTVSSGTLSLKPAAATAVSSSGCIALCSLLRRAFRWVVQSMALSIASPKVSQSTWPRRVYESTLSFQVRLPDSYGAVSFHTHCSPTLCSIQVS